MTDICMPLVKYVFFTVFSWVCAAVAYVWGKKAGAKAVTDKIDAEVFKKLGVKV